MSAGDGAAAAPAPLFSAQPPSVGHGTAYAVDAARGVVYAFGGVCYGEGSSRTRCTAMTWRGASNDDVFFL